MEVAFPVWRSRYSPSEVTTRCESAIRRPDPDALTVGLLTRFTYGELFFVRHMATKGETEKETDIGCPHQYIHRTSRDIESSVDSMIHSSTVTAVTRVTHRKYQHVESPQPTHRLFLR